MEENDITYYAFFLKIIRMYNTCTWLDNINETIYIIVIN